MKHEHHSIVLFDGICIFCNATVQFIIRHDPQKKIKFAALQSECGKEICDALGIDIHKTDSIVLIKNKQVYQKSTAVLNISKQLNNGISLLYIFSIIPPFIRDGVYDFVARKRYRWFGKKEQCVIPDKEATERFIC